MKTYIDFFTYFNEHSSELQTFILDIKAKIKIKNASNVLYALI